MKLNILFSFLLIILLFSGCKKDKAIEFSGQLLLSKKYPIPIKNRDIEIYQAGSASAIGLNSGSSSSTSTGITDANGNFRLSFTAGKSRFIVFSGSNSSPLTLGNSPSDTSFPRFQRQNFPDSGYDAASPIFVGKIIDTAVIIVRLLSKLSLNDSIGLQGVTINGYIEKYYTGLTGNIGDVIKLDSIHNMLFTLYRGFNKEFYNDIYAGYKRPSVVGSQPSYNSAYIDPPVFSKNDEPFREIIFYFKKQ